MHSIKVGAQTGASIEPQPAPAATPAAVVEKPTPHKVALYALSAVCSYHCYYNPYSAVVGAVLGGVVSSDKRITISGEFTTYATTAGVLAAWALTPAGSVAAGVAAALIAREIFDDLTT